LLPILEAADETGQPPIKVASTYFAVGGALELPWYLQQLTSLPGGEHLAGTGTRGLS